MKPGLNIKKLKISKKNMKSVTSRIVIVISPFITEKDVLFNLVPVFKRLCICYLFSQVIKVAEESLLTDSWRNKIQIWLQQLCRHLFIKNDIIDNKIDHKIISFFRLASPDQRDAFGIIVSYAVKVKLYLGALGGELAAELPFVLMHPKVIGSVVMSNLGILSIFFRKNSQNV